VKIAIDTRFYPPDTGGGGIAAYAHYAALGLKKAGHKVSVISAQANGSLAYQSVDGIEVHRIPAPLSSYRWSRLPIVGRQMRFVRDLIYAWRVRQLLLSGKLGFQPDIVEYADIDAEGFFHANSLCPHVIKLHTPHSVLKHFYSSREIPYALGGVEWMERRTIRSANGISSPSLYLAEQVANDIGIEQSRIQYVPNFIDTNQFVPDSVTDQSQSLSVLYVGRLEPLKGAVIFAKAIPFIRKEFSKARFIFLGVDRSAEDGTSQKAQLERFFIQESVMDHVEFHWHDTPDVFLSYYRKAAVFVMPSLFENSPYTLLEAMSCGKACVVSRAGGMTEMLVDGESGLFFEPGNSADLTEKVIALLKNPPLRKSLGQAARQRAEREYSLDVGIEKTVAFYRNVLVWKDIQGG
jgi:glycogen(starch) synthase